MSKKKLRTVPAWQVDRKGYTRYTRASCIDCGTERWVQCRNNKVDNPRCRKCEGMRRTKESRLQHLRNQGFLGRIKTVWEFIHWGF